MNQIQLAAETWIETTLSNGAKIIEFFATEITIGPMAVSAGWAIYNKKGELISVIKN